MSATEQRRDRRHELRREAILAAAATEFAEHGYHGATLDRIGERIGLSKASLYHYVTGKEELLASLLEQVTDRIAAAATAPPQTAAVERLRRFVRAHVREASTTPEGTVLAENLDALMTRGTSGGLAQVRRRHEDRLVAIVRAGIETGEFHPVPVGPAVKLLFAALNSVPRWFDPAGRLTLEEISDQVLDMLSHGLVRQ